MEWEDDGIVLGTRPLGEGGAVAMLLTRGHGRHAGLVSGGQSGRGRAALEPGTRVRCRWRARLADQLGFWSLEPIRAHAAGFMDAPSPLAALLSATALLDAVLPEREAHPGLFDATLVLFDLLDTPVWGEAYVKWETGLLAAAGFGLDLEACALTGVAAGAMGNDHLAYVSPRTGRAVSLSASEPYRDRLLALPGFLVGRGGGGPVEVAMGLALTGHFLERHVLAAHHQPLPGARLRLAERQARDAGLADTSHGMPGNGDTASGSV